MVICESVKQKECSVRKAKTVYLLWSVQTVEMELLIPWSAQLTPKVTKRKCLHWGLCLKKGPFTSGIPAHLRHSFETSNLSAGRARPAPWPEFDRLPEDPTAEGSGPLPLTPRASCLSSHPKTQYFIASPEAKGPHRAPIEVCIRTAWVTRSCENTFG